tara:strand:+ start:499 stop:720 length:222 start_codon:yes stop_codon:yes gene_type:complete
MSKRDYYDILGVDRSAQGDELKKAYRKLAMKYHPIEIQMTLLLQKNSKKLQRHTRSCQILQKDPLTISLGIKV